MGSILKRLHAHPTLFAVLQKAVVALAMLATLVFSPQEGEAKTLGGTYKGLTSQGQPGLIRTPNGHRITVAKIQLSVHCSDGPTVVLPVSWKPMPIVPSGRFGEVLTGTDEEEGSIFNLTARLSGRFTADRTAVTAKAQVNIVEHEADGSVVTCNSGVATLHAKV